MNTVVPTSFSMYAAQHHQSSSPERTLSHALETCPKHALSILDQCVPEYGDRFEQLTRFWNLLDEAMDAWILTHPEWPSLLQHSIANTQCAHERKTFESLLSRHEQREPVPQKTQQEREATQQRFFQANLDLDAALSPFFSIQAKRACYVIRLEIIRQGITSSEHDDMPEFITWRQTVARHLEEQIKQTDQTLSMYRAYA